jgi:hypothetical protein
MKQTLQNILITTALFLNAVFFFGCTSTMVSIPDASHDQKPVITVHSVTSGPGKVSPHEVSVTTGKPVGVTEKTNVMIIVDATNMGGVKHLSIVGHLGGTKLWEAKIEASPNAQNLVPRTLTIIGHNGLGGIGSQPLIIGFGNLYETGYVIANAVNFNGQSQDLQVNYEVLPLALIP